MLRSATTVRPRHRIRRELVGISLGYFMVLLDTTVLAVAEPDLIASLHTDVIGVGWATTTYTMALAASLVLGGRISDRLGADRVFRIGSGGFGLVSLACALSPDLSMLLLSRSLLGLLAAAIIPSSMGLLAAVHPDPADRAFGLGVWASISGAAMVAGPVLGGWLVELSGWRAVFLINVPLALLVLLLSKSAVRCPRDARKISFAPHLGLVATLAAVTLAVTESGQRSWLPALVAIAAAGAAAALTARLDRGSTTPLVPDALRHQRAVWAGFAWGAIANYALVSVLFAVPLTLHEGALRTGITLLPMTLLIAVNPLATARLVTRFGPLLPIRLGFGAFAIGLGTTAVTMAGGQQPFALGIGLLACGLGVSWILPSLVGHILSQAPPGTTGVVGGLLNAARQVGATLGAATASAVLFTDPDGARAGVPFAAAGALCLLGLVSSIRGPRTTVTFAPAGSSSGQRLRSRTR